MLLLINICSKMYCNVSKLLVKLNSVVLVHKRTISTELPQSVGEVSANFNW
jgi:hypothetical protein